MQQEECDCDEKKKPEAKKEAPDSRAVATMVNLVKNRMRARGLNMSYDMEGESIDEVVGAVAGVAKVGALAAKGVAKAAPVVAKGVVKGAKVAGKAISKGAKMANKAGKKVNKAVDTADKATDVALKMQKLKKQDREVTEVNQVEAKDPFADKPYDKFGRSKDPKARKKAQEKASTLRSSDRRSGRNTYGSRLGYDKKEWDESVNPVEESAEDRLRDQRQERGGVDGNTRYDRPPARKRTNAELGIKPGKTMAQKEMEKKYGKGATAMDIVKAQIRAKHGKGAIKD